MTGLWHCNDENVLDCEWTFMEKHASQFHLDRRLLDGLMLRSDVWVSRCVFGLNYTDRDQDSVVLSTSLSLDELSSSISIPLLANSIALR